jgi:Fe-S cluster assembly protein SufB
VPNDARRQHDLQDHLQVDLEGQWPRDVRLVKVRKGAHDQDLRAVRRAPDRRRRPYDTYPTMEIAEDQVRIEHEARVSKIGDEQLFYLRSRGLKDDQARLMIVNGFIEPFVKELPMEYAVELNRLIELEMEGSVG